MNSLRGALNRESQGRDNSSIPNRALLHNHAMCHLRFINYSQEKQFQRNNNFTGGAPSGAVKPEQQYS
jgi:hypothetical protein